MNYDVCSMTHKRPIAAKYLQKQHVEQFNQNKTTEVRVTETATKENTHSV